MKRTLRLLCAVCLALCTACGAKQTAMPPEAVQAATEPLLDFTPQEDDYYAATANDALGWGFRRNLPSRPELTEAQTYQMTAYDCIYMGSDTEAVLYLTFDEGYENGYTAAILDTLKEKQVPAAFFVTAPYLKTEGDLVRRMIDEGHIVGNHSVNHPSLPSLTKEELERELFGLDLMLYEGYGVHSRYLRPPRGEYSERTLSRTRDWGYCNVFWSLAYQDWDVNAQKGADYALKTVTDNLHNGAVILLHAVSRDNSEALGAIIDAARAAGYEFKSLDEYKW